MKHLFLQRKSRCAICLLAIAMAAYFLYWDAGRLAASEPVWTPGPQYLVVWLGAIVTAVIGVLILVLDSVFALRRNRRPESEGHQPRQEEPPAVNLLTRF